MQSLLKQTKPFIRNNEKNTAVTPLSGPKAITTSRIGNKTEKKLTEINNKNVNYKIIIDQMTTTSLRNYLERNLHERF